MNCLEFSSDHVVCTHVGLTRVAHCRTPSIVLPWCWSIGIEPSLKSPAVPCKKQKTHLLLYRHEIDHGCRKPVRRPDTKNEARCCDPEHFWRAAKKRRDPVYNLFLENGKKYLCLWEIFRAVHEPVYWLWHEKSIHSNWEISENNAAFVDETPKQLCLGDDNRNCPTRFTATSTRVYTDRGRTHAYKYELLQIACRVVSYDVTIPV